MTRFDVAVSKRRNRLRPARRCYALLGAVADAVIIERLGIPGAIRDLQAVVGGVPQRRIVARRDVVPDVGEVERIGVREMKVRNVYSPPKEPRRFPIRTRSPSTTISAPSILTPSPTLTQIAVWPTLHEV